MTTRRLAIAFALFTALAAMAKESQPVLGTDGAIYTVDSAAARLHIVRKVGDERTHMLVPVTRDSATESDANLIWDASSSALFVIWNRISDRGDQIMLARLDSEGNWSDPVLMTPDTAAKRVGLTAVLTRSADGATTFLHAAWWTLGGDPVAEYALVTFDHRTHLSTSVSDLNSLAAVNAAQSLTREPMTEVLHPPLAITRNLDSVDVLFGADGSTAVTRLRITPRLVPNARIWKPVGRSGERLPNAKLASNTGAPVQAVMSKGRVILYTAESKFRFVIFDEGRWSPERVIHLDETVTNDQLERELHLTVEQLRIAQPQGTRQ